MANPFNTFVTNWQKRQAVAAQLGIPQSALQPVMQMDAKRLQTGSAPYTNEEALAALSGSAGTPVIKQQGPSKPDWNPLHLLGHAATDIGTIGKGISTLPRQVAHDVAHIDELPGQIAKGAGDIAKGDVGHGLQEITQAPGLLDLLFAADFIPGVNTITAPITAGVLAAGEAGKVSTPEGRKDISRHPLVNLLQVTPAAGELGKLTEEGSLSAHLGQAVKDSRVATATEALKNTMGVTGPYRALWRNLSDARKEALTKTEGALEGARQLFGRHAEDPAAVKEISTILARGNPAEIAAAEAKYPGIGPIGAGSHEITDHLGQRGVASGDLVALPNPDTGVMDFYPAKSINDLAHGELTKAKDTLSKGDVEFRRATGNLVKKAQAEKEAIPPDPKQIVESLKPAAAAENDAGGPIATAIEKITRGKKTDYTDAAHNLEVAGGFDEQVAQLRGLRAARKAYGDAKAAHTNARSTATRLEAALDKQKLAVQRAESRFQKVMAQNPSARWTQNLQDAMHPKVEAWVETFFHGTQAQKEAVMGQIARRYYDGVYDNGERIVPLAELNTIKAQAVAQVNELQARGWKPVFVHSVTEGQWQALSFPEIQPRMSPKMSQYKEKIWDQRPSTEGPNLIVSLTHQQAEFFKREQWDKITKGFTDPATGHHVDGLFEPGKWWASTRDKEIQALMDRGEMTKTQAAEQVDREWDSVSHFGGRGDVIIPKHLAANLNRLTPENVPLKELTKKTGKYVRGYRFAVTGLSPQHMLHVAASGAVMMSMAAQDLPGILRAIPEARRMLREGNIPIRFRDETSQLATEDAMVMNRSYNSMTKIYRDTVAKGVHPFQRINAAINHFDEHLTQWYKTLDYVSQTQHGLSPEQALLEVGKHFADHAGRSPLERAVFKTVVPFGSWTQHLLKYTFQFPIDHPVRMGIMANLATAEFNDQLGGLPKNFAQLFFLGKNAFDVRSFNPFRDLGRDFTLAGFISSLNPAVESIFRTVGYDPIADSAELYPELQVDPNTGKLITKGGNFWMNLAESSVPQVQGIEGLLGMSDRLRQLKKTDPSAYRYTLGRMLHVPWLPQTIDVHQAKAKEELNTLKVAQQTESNAMRSGDFSKAATFNLLPFQGGYQKPQTLQALYDLLKKQNALPPNALLRR